MTRRARGCLAPVVAPHEHRVSFRLHHAMTATPPAAVDLRETDLVAAVKDQGGSSSCEGHSCSGAIETACAIAGAPLPFIPSEASLYTGARSIERARNHDLHSPLVDEGALTEDVIAFVASFGVSPRSVQMTSDGRNSDVELAAVNDELKLGKLEQAAQRLMIGPYAVNPAARDAELQVQSALAAGIPVRVDAFVDAAFENWERGDAPVGAPDTSDPYGGGHAIYIVGYRPGAYIVRNSWGTGYADGGDVLVSPAWLRAAWGLYPFVVKWVTK